MVSQPNGQAGGGLASMLTILIKGLVQDVLNHLIIAQKYKINVMATQLCTLFKPIYDI